ncbi:hypothetical protein V2K55_10040 [Pseudomonas alliivorans]|nr:hypothetical protein [Pseudomonas alliivorans]MEE4778170.1 hypothetical protein [Pseudomonas alliivorans]MEE4997444.1 hypothetical protein [Pseudomonas alliivorans]MEE5041444.1 hypothetical protein [Pseudomonas alliivorans]MEE5152906.1 hypothetical protein [Pseudomonas alliivorans]
MNLSLNMLNLYEGLGMALKTNVERAQEIPTERLGISKFPFGGTEKFRVNAEVTVSTLGVS